MTDDYKGPERRKDVNQTLQTVEELRQSVDTLTGRVGTLTGQLEEVNVIRLRQQELDGQAREAFQHAAEALAKAREVESKTAPRTEVNENLALERHERKQDRRQGQTVGLTLLALIAALIYVVVHQTNYQHATRASLEDLKGHSFNSCQVRNQQLAAVEVILSAVVAIEGGIHPPPGGQAIKDKLDAILEHLPGPVDCAKVYGPPKAAT